MAELKFAMARAMTKGTPRHAAEAGANRALGCGARVQPPAEDGRKFDPDAPDVCRRCAQAARGRAERERRTRDGA